MMTRRDWLLAAIAALCAKPAAAEMDMTPLRDYLSGKMDLPDFLAACRSIAGSPAVPDEAVQTSGRLYFPMEYVMRWQTDGGYYTLARPIGDKVGTSG